MTSYAPITSHPALACAALLTVSNLFMLKLDFVWAGMCLMGAVYFIFPN